MEVMHKMGLHGKSFIPMLMGFGCNVPAIMATRTIESRSSRIITILVTPFMSCSARLPVMVLFAGAFFPDYAPLVLILLYLLGIATAIITARLLRVTKFKNDETPFVMELPPYRWPTLRATIRHMWEKCAQYLKKIGTVILLSTVVIWFLSYYPRPEESTENRVQRTEYREQRTENREQSTEYRVQRTEYREQSTEDREQSRENRAKSEDPGINENSFIAMIGHAVEPILAPLGQNWHSSIALITSIPAKELVVSTLGVLYCSDSEEGIEEDLRASGDFTPRSAAAFLVFILLFFPCIATITTIANETGSRKWALFSIVYNTAVAWIAGFLVYTIGGLI